MANVCRIHLFHVFKATAVFISQFGNEILRKKEKKRKQKLQANPTNKGTKMLLDYKGAFNLFF